MVAGGAVCAKMLCDYREFMDARGAAERAAWYATESRRELAETCDELEECARRIEQSQSLRPGLQQPLDWSRLYRQEPALYWWCQFRSILGPGGAASSGLQPREPRVRVDQGRDLPPQRPHAAFHENLNAELQALPPALQQMRNATQQELQERARQDRCLREETARRWRRMCQSMEADIVHSMRLSNVKMSGSGRVGTCDSNSGTYKYLCCMSAKKLSISWHASRKFLMRDRHHETCSKLPVMFLPASDAICVIRNMHDKSHNLPDGGTFAFESVSFPRTVED
ncbi:unnamed protein product [Amoebophrya sp. A120]|nr:unnamed protein product [Amoebophrya sp. A120]|eukprot:GSA120T00006833001.1